MAKRTYIDITPRYSEIGTFWKRVVSDATRVNKPDQMKLFWEHFDQMSECSDRYNDLIRFLRTLPDWSDERIASALESGKSLQEERRHTVIEEEVES